MYSQLYFCCWIYHINLLIPWLKNLPNWPLSLNIFGNIQFLRLANVFFTIYNYRFSPPPNWISVDHQDSVAVSLCTGNFITAKCCVLSCRIFSHLATLQLTMNASFKYPNPSTSVTTWSYGSIHQSWLPQIRQSRDCLVPVKKCHFGAKFFVRPQTYTVCKNKLWVWHLFDSSSKCWHPPVLESCNV